jgi:hypothetical protein
LSSIVKPGWWRKIKGLNEAVQKLGTLAAVAKYCNIAPASLQDWSVTGVPPGLRCAQISILTGLELYEIRPDQYGKLAPKKASRTQKRKTSQSLEKAA